MNATKIALFAGHADNTYHPAKYTRPPQQALGAVTTTHSCIQKQNLPALINPKHHFMSQVRSNAAIRQGGLRAKESADMSQTVRTDKGGLCEAGEGIFHPES